MTVAAPRELVIAASPIWILLRDAFTTRAPRGPVTIRLERRIGSGWVEFEHAWQLSSAGHLGFVNLGRSRDPAAVGTFDVRVHVSSPGTIAEAPGGDAAITAPVSGWWASAPAPAAPTELVLYPGPAYAFPSRTPLVAGRVLDAHGAPVPRARVWSTAKVQNALLTEEVRSDDDGRFRLPVRWSVGATDVQSTRGGQAGFTTVDVPADLSFTHQITLT